MLEPLPDDDLIRCPNCAELIHRDAILCRFCEKGLSDEHFYPCPSCAESIRKEATFCRFCRSKLGSSSFSDLSLTDAIRDRITQQSEILITKHGKPVARLVSIDDKTMNKIFADNLDAELSKEDPDPKFWKLLLSIETNQNSCCIKVVSPKHKSRGIVLIFRGRVVGCIFGNKRFERQLFGQEAYSCILADMSHQSNIIDAYLLSEDLVLAATSLFNGEVFHADSGNSPEEIFEAAHRGLIHSRMPGCIVVKSDDETLSAITYIFGGKIIGIYSSKEGWVSTSYEKALQYVVHTPGAKVLATMLVAKNIEEVMSLSFGISGLEEPKKEHKPSGLQEPFLLDIFDMLGNSH